MTRGATVLGIFLFSLTAGPAWAQTDERPSPVPQFLEVPAADVLPSGRVGVTFSYRNDDERQGVTDVTQYGLQIAVGVKGRLELFGTGLGRRVHRNVDGPTFDATDSSVGGISNNFPFVRRSWTSGLGGPILAGAKVNLLSASRQDPMAMAVQVTGKFPVGATAGGTKDLDMRLDLTGGKELGGGLDLTGAIGYVFRGDPDEIRLVDSVIWGFGGAFPSRTPFRGLLEVHGETATSSETTTVGPLVAEDGSIAPSDSRTKSTYRLRSGAVWQPQGGFFLVAGASYTLGLADNISGRAVSRHPWGADIQIGFRPSARRLPAPIQQPAAPAAAVAPPVAVAAAPPPAPAPVPAPRPAAPAAPAAPAPRAALNFEEVHFDFDRSEIRPEDRARLTEAARVLNANPGVRVTIEGHADELGTSEYNLALGERRARSVYDYLVGLGVAGGRLTTVSYGEARPRYDRQSGQADLNRRAALVVVP